VAVAEPPAVTEDGERVPEVGSVNGEAAVPVRVTVCGLFVASSVTVSVAMRVPDALGLKLTLTVQAVPPATNVQLLFCAKSAAFVPEIATPVTFKVVEL